MNTESVLENISDTREIEKHEDPLVKKEHKKRVKYYRTGLDQPPKEILLEQRHDPSLLKVWFGFGGGI